ncbi:hypothetical protein BG20_I1951 [Candidatus Nitrosarchaeum limnium BG20]|uniref:Histidinol dehydrogenase n=1 Tax=Candidatus Nitrosarchaeum limnium BG20 TaxID=859192 RepID=S2E9P5_9ARCH|nr:histidinol dehydrogenase [Candidatus Nitrosarchaeum limnium]EPA06086.1 hypothetical protein BG20_I1951 [Candidatus Nitrosarchaeum limnium BG20]
MKIIRVTNVDKFVSQVLPKQPQKNKLVVDSILKDVQKNGDFAIKKFEEKFSGSKITSLRLSQNEIKSAFSKVSQNEINAIKLSKQRLEKTESSVKSILKK